MQNKNDQHPRTPTERGSVSQSAEMNSMMEKLLHWAAIVESSDDAIISKSMDGKITSWNRGAQKLYGYTAEEIIGKPVSILMPADRVDDFPNILEVLREGKKVDHYETRRKTKEGRIIDVSITVSPIRDPSGKIIGASKIARDISDRVEYQKRREDFINSASHELKTPITTQKVYGHLLREKVENAGDNQYMPFIEKIVRQTEKLEKLVTDLLQMSKDGDFRLESKLFCLETLIDDVISDFEPTTRHQIVKRKNGTNWMKGDPERISQVFNNLLSNAIKYSDEGSKIIVTTHRKDHMAQVSVQDFGVGIDKLYHEKIFEKFYRIHKSTYPGMGIGLNLCQHVIRKHGGKIWVESEPGKGATFHFTLPSAKEEDAL